jgi:hypothetical protein
MGPPPPARAPVCAAPAQLEPSRHLLDKAQRNLKLAVAGQNYPDVRGWTSEGGGGGGLGAGPRAKAAAACRPYRDARGGTHLSARRPATQGLGARPGRAQMRACLGPCLFQSLLP